MTPSELKQFIRDTSTKLGFSHIGISPTSHDILITQRLNQWLNNGYHASMEWMLTRSEERNNINNYFPEAKSVISLAMNYFTGNVHKNNNIGKISNYAWGDDYHATIKPRLYKLLNSIKAKNPNKRMVLDYLQGQDPRKSSPCTFGTHLCWCYRHL